MIDVTSRCTTRLEVIGQKALVYLHLWKNDGVSRDGAIGFFNLQGFSPMLHVGERVKVIETSFGWFSVKIDRDYYTRRLREYATHPELEKPVITGGSK